MKKLFLIFFIFVGVVSLVLRLGIFNPVRKATILKPMLIKPEIIEKPKLAEKDLSLKSKGGLRDEAQPQLSEEVLPPTHDQIMQKLEEEKLKAEIADLKKKNNIFDKGTILSILGIFCTLYLGRKKK